MNHCRLPDLIVTSIVIILCSASATESQAELAVYDFIDGVPQQAVCGRMDLPGHVSFYAEPTGEEICGVGGCLALVGFEPESGPAGMLLYMTTLSVYPHIYLDWASLTVFSIEVDVENREGSPPARLIDLSDETVIGEAAEPGLVTLTSNNGHPVALQCCYCTVAEIRVDLEFRVPVGTAGWSTLKSRYRSGG